MKKIIITIGVLIVLGFLGYFIYVNYINKVPRKSISRRVLHVWKSLQYQRHSRIIR